MDKFANNIRVDKILVVANERRMIRTDRRSIRIDRRAENISDNSQLSAFSWFGNRRHSATAERRDLGSPNRRNSDQKTISKQSIDFLFEFLQWRGQFLTEHIRDKEKKKLAIIVSSFAVFSLVTTVVLATISSDKIKPDMFVSPAFNILLGIFIIGIASINTSIIKHVMSLKADGLLFLRQLNCLRQALHVVMFAKLDGYLPADLVQTDLSPQASPDNEEKAEDQSQELHSFMHSIKEIIQRVSLIPRKKKPLRHESEKRRCEALRRSLFDSETDYWHLYGRHEKLPMDNEFLRNSYDSPLIFFYSADMFSVVIIALFTVLLTVAPALYLIPNIGVENEGAWFIGRIGIAVSFIFVVLVIIIVKSALNKIRHELDGDHPGITHFRKTVQECLIKNTTD